MKRRRRKKNPITPRELAKRKDAQALQRNKLFAAPKDVMNDALDKEEILAEGVAGFKDLMKGREGIIALGGYDRRFHVATVLRRMLFMWERKSHKHVSDKQFRSAYGYWVKIIASIVASIPQQSGRDKRTGLDVDPVFFARRAFLGGLGVSPSRIGDEILEALKVQAVVTISPQRAESHVTGDTRGTALQQNYENLHELISSDADAFGMDLPDIDVEAGIREVAAEIMYRYDQGIRPNPRAPKPTFQVWAAGGMVHIAMSSDVESMGPEIRTWGQAKKAALGYTDRSTRGGMYQSEARASIRSLTLADMKAYAEDGEYFSIDY